MLPLHFLKFLLVDHFKSRSGGFLKTFFAVWRENSNFVAVAPGLSADVALEVGGVATVGVPSDRVVVGTSRQRRNLFARSR